MQKFLVIFITSRLPKNKISFHLFFCHFHHDWSDLHLTSSISSIDSSACIFYFYVDIKPSIHWQKLPLKIILYYFFAVDFNLKTIFDFILSNKNRTKKNIVQKWIIIIIMQNFATFVQIHFFNLLRFNNIQVDKRMKIKWKRIMLCLHLQKSWLWYKSKLLKSFVYAPQGYYTLKWTLEA